MSLGAVYDNSLFVFLSSCTLRARTWNILDAQLAVVAEKSDVGSHRQKKVGALYHKK